MHLTLGDAVSTSETLRPSIFTFGNLHRLPQSRPSLATSIHGRIPPAHTPFGCRLGSGFVKSRAGFLVLRRFRKEGGSSACREPHPKLRRSGTLLRENVFPTHRSLLRLRPRAAPAGAPSRGWRLSAPALRMPLDNIGSKTIYFEAIAISENPASPRHSRAVTASGQCSPRADLKSNSLTPE
jgi:hypothetical protein